MIDKPRVRFLDLECFGVRGRRSLDRLRALSPLFLLIAGLGGCSPRSRPGPVEETLTSGRISVVCAGEAYALIARERAAFRELYPRAVIEVRLATSQEALRALFAAECDLAVITRELSDDERAAAVRGRLELEGYRFARDALVVVVNPRNPVENVSMEELQGIYRGRVTDWSRLAGPPGAIRPVIQPLESDVTGYFLQTVMSDQPILARVLTENSDSAVVAHVAADPAAVGYATLAWANMGAKALRVAAIRGLVYTRPDPETVHDGKYPLSRFFNFYTRAGGRPLANGFITFVTSRPGQRIVEETGLVPTSVPVRFVHRSPMLKSH